MRLREEILNQLTEENACYILITCKEPNQTGELPVEMSYSGDPTLAAYLLQDAQHYLEEECLEREAADL